MHVHVCMCVCVCVCVCVSEGVCMFVFMCHIPYYLCYDKML